MKLLVLTLLAFVGYSLAGEAAEPCRCEMCPGSSVANPEMTAEVEGEVATCEDYYVFMCNFVPPNACDAFQAGTSECCGGAAGDNPPPEADESEDTCPDGTGCDICPEGPIVDDSKIVTYQTETATCAEWFLFGCIFAEPDICDALVAGVSECCDTDAEVETTAGPETTGDGATAGDEVCRCEMCPGSSVANPEMTATVEEEVATCEEFYVFMCSFVPPNACDAFQAGTSECCGGAAGDNPTPEADESEDECPDGSGCDICPNGPIVDDSKVVTYGTETATCAEWFLFGCIFAEPDICDDLVAGVSDCCDSDAEVETTAGPETTGDGATAGDEVCRCEMCPGSSVANPDMTATVEEEVATCEEFYVFMCNFVPPNACDAFKAGTSECCGGAAGDNPTPEADASQDMCPDGTGCDICPMGTIIDDSNIVTYGTETATCAEWFLFGCTFAEPDICDDLVAGVAECCGGDSATTAEPPATTGEPEETTTVAEGGSSETPATTTTTTPSSAAHLSVAFVGAAVGLAMLA